MSFLGYGRDEDDFIEENMVYCMGGTGIIYSNALVRSIRPHLPTCIKQLYTVMVSNFCQDFHPILLQILDLNQRT